MPKYEIQSKKNLNFLPKYHLKLLSLLQEFQSKTTHLSEIDYFTKRNYYIIFIPKQ